MTRVRRVARGPLPQRIGGRMMPVCMAEDEAMRVFKF